MPELVRNRRELSKNTFCTCPHTNLWYGGESIGSQSGVQQGDPLGPLPFCLALQPLLQRLKEVHGNNGLDLAFGYLDDCVLAGSATTVALAFDDLQRAAAAIGLKVSMGRDKSLLVPCAGQSADLSNAVFPAQREVQTDGNFEFLGSPIGSPSFCCAHTTKRVAKAKTLLKALGELPDPSVALLLLRHCAAFCKLVYSCRVTPHSCHTTALNEFDASVQECFESFLCTGFSANEWSLATLSTSHCGAGLRASARHSAAAFLASTCSCYDLCRKLDPDHTVDLNNTTSSESLALADFNASVCPDDRLTPTADSEKFKQRELSKQIDNKILQDLKQAVSSDDKHAAHFELTSAPHTGSWLHATPSPNLGNYSEPLLFRLSVQRRLRAPILPEDTICHLCNGVLDKFGDHCLVCPNGGDRTRRHNHQRNLVYHYAQSAGLNPELEKPGLLQPRPFLGSLPENGVLPNDPTARRPADVYIPRWRQGLPLAIDFAITSGLRTEMVRSSLQDPAAALTAYEDHKRNHLHTERLCAEAHIGFAPAIQEADGGSWSISAQKVFSELAKNKAQLTGEPKDTLLRQLHENLSVSLHRDNARAIAKRVNSYIHNMSEVIEAATTLQSAAASLAAGPES